MKVLSYGLALLFTGATIGTAAWLVFGPDPNCGKGLWAGCCGFASGAGISYLLDGDNL